MYKRQSQVPLLELEKQIVTKQRKKLVIDITAPPLKLQRSRYERNELMNKSRRVLRPLGRSSYHKIPPTQEERQSLLDESKTTPETLEDLPSGQDSSAYIFSLKRCNVQEQYRSRADKKAELAKKIIKFYAHPDDKVCDRIQSVEVDFRPMTVEESFGVNRNQDKNSQTEDRFKRFQPQRKYYKVYPTLFINKDHKRGLFGIEVNRPDYNLNVQKEHMMHDTNLNKVLQRLSDQYANDENNPIFKPKPTNKYCFVCKSQYDEYIEHIETRCHKQNDSNAKIWPLIKDICKKVQGLAVQEKLKHLKWKKFEQKVAKKIENKTLKSKNHFHHEHQTKKSASEEKSKENKHKNKQKSIQKNKQSKSLSKLKETNLSIQKNKPFDLKQSLAKNIESKQGFQQNPKQVHTQFAQHHHQETPMPFLAFIQQPQLKAIKNAQKYKANRIETEKREKQNENLNGLQKAIKIQTPIPIITENQVQVSILHSQYPKLVPEGQSYRKPSRPATVSLCLTTNNEETKKEKKKSERKKKETKQDKNKDVSVYKQQKIEDWCNVKKNEIKQNAQSKDKVEKIEQELKNSKNKDYKDKQIIHLKHHQPISSQTPSKSSEQRPRFAWLAKTRQRQKRAVKDSENMQLSPIVTE